jgi:DDE family transposase
LERAPSATTDDNLSPFAFPAIERKKVTAAFDGERLSSDDGVMLLSQAERRLGLAEGLAEVIPDERDANRVIHRLPDILRARIFAIACSYEDADDLDGLRSDPTFKLACGRLPDTGTDLCSQPTVPPFGVGRRSFFIPVSERAALLRPRRLRGVELPVALFDAASPLVPGNDDADMVRASPLACSGDFLLRLAGC